MRRKVRKRAKNAQKTQRTTRNIVRICRKCTRHVQKGAAKHKIAQNAQEEIARNVHEMRKMRAKGAKRHFDVFVLGKNSKKTSNILRK